MVKIKYFFGYRRTLGQIFPVRWVEEDGVPIGGRFDTLQKDEITRQEFLDTTTFLVGKYPCKEDMENSSPSG